MKAAGNFKKLTRERPSEVGKHLDKVPLAGAVTVAQSADLLGRHHGH
jgi:hypothetical protein